MNTTTPLAVIDGAQLRRDGDVIPFSYSDSFGREQEGFVLRWQGEFFAYQNLCPHWSAPLDEYGDGLFSHGSNALICQTHGALFEPHSGECVSGPCVGDKLKKFRVQTDDDGQLIITRAGLSLS